MIVKGCFGGPGPKTSGGGYRLRVYWRDRDEHFRRTWRQVTIMLPGTGEIEVSVSPSFWRKCPELRSAQIGWWMIKCGLAPWPRGKPPAFELQPLGEARFRLKRSKRK